MMFWPKISRPATFYALEDSASHINSSEGAAMKPKLTGDPDSMIGLLPRRWYHCRRPLRNLLMVVTTGGLAMLTYADQARPRRPTPRAFPAPGRRSPLPQPQPAPGAPSGQPAPRGRWTVDDAMISPAPAGVDDAMILTAPAGIDEGMIVSPARRQPQQLPTFPMPGTLIPGAPAPRTPEGR
jgi:hypothetical protein